MKTTMTALAVLLMASAGSVVAQPRERGERPQAGESRGDRGDRGDRGGPRFDRGGGGGERRSPGDFNGRGYPRAQQQAPQAQAAPQAPRAPEARQDGGGRRGEGRGPGGGRRWTDNDGDGGQRSPADRADREDRRELRQWRDYQRDGGGGPRVVQPRGTDQRRFDRDPGRRDQGEWRGDRDRRDGRYDRDGSFARDRGDRNWQGRWNQADRDRWSRYDRDRDLRRGNRPYWRQGLMPFNYSSPRRYRGGYWSPPPGFSMRVWSFGDYLPFGWYDDTYRLDDWWSYGLPWPPAGYDWVRVGTDAVLVDRFSGRVVQVVRMLFW